MDYQKAIEYMRKESHNQCVNSEGQDAYIIAISAMQELQEQREIINKNKDYSEVQKWMQNIIDDAMVCLDEMKRDAKKNLNTHYIPLLYEGRKRKAKTVIYALIELNAYKQLGTLEEVREAVEKHKWIPCSERLPEESGKYEVTALDAGRLIVTQVKWQPKLKSWNLTGAMAYWKITAWKPLPEPYRPNKCLGCFGAANNDCERCTR